MKTHHTFTYWVHICSILTAPLLGAHLYCLDIGSSVLLGTLFDWSTGFLFYWLHYIILATLLVAPFSPPLMLAVPRFLSLSWRLPSTPPQYWFLCYWMTDFCLFPIIGWLFLTARILVMVHLTTTAINQGICL
jgi:hypothetical protein